MKATPRRPNAWLPCTPTKMALGRIERQEGHAGENAAMFERLAAVIAKYQLPLKPFYDLLSAFKQDVETTRYASYDDVLDYCARSANPVGLLMLHLYGAADEQNVRDSDAICSALQLINFLQDVAIDQQKERIYLPMEDLSRFAVSAAAFERPEAHGKWSALMRFEVARARALMLSGAPLALRLRGRIGWELRLVVQGGLRILEAHRSGQLRRVPAPSQAGETRLADHFLARPAHVAQKPASRDTSKNGFSPVAHSVRR